MGSIPGVRFDITGASGSQGLLSPMSGWFCYVFPRGGFASQDSTGTLITFDSASVASRFAANNWIQVGTDTSKIRKVSGVGGNSISVSGSAVTVATNDRVLIIGNTQPTVVGGSATYITPQSLIYQRDDDGSTLYSNSMVTTDSNGGVQFFGGPALFDCMIQDSRQSAQGLLADLPVGAVEGISTSMVSVFGATATFNAAIGVTGWATFGATVTINAALGVTGTVVAGSTLTANANFGVTGTALFGKTVTVNGALGVTGWGTFGASVTIAGALGLTGTLAVGSTSTFSANINLSGVTLSQMSGNTAVAQLAPDGTMYFGDGTVAPSQWGIAATQTLLSSTATITISNVNNYNVTKDLLGATFTLGATPTIANGGYGGQQLMLINFGSNTFTFQHTITGLSSSGLRLGAATRAVGPRGVLGLIWVGGITNEWWELYFKASS